MSTGTAHLLSVSEAADLLRVSADTVRRWIATGRLPAFRCGRVLRVGEVEVARFIAANTTLAKVTPPARARRKPSPRRQQAAPDGSEVLDPRERLRLLRAAAAG